MWTNHNYTSPQGFLKAIPAAVENWYEIIQINNVTIACFNSDTGETHLFQCKITPLLLLDIADLVRSIIQVRNNKPIEHLYSFSDKDIQQIEKGLIALSNPENKKTNNELDELLEYLHKQVRER